MSRRSPEFAKAWSAYWSATHRGSIDLLSAQDPVAARLRAHWLGQIPWLRHCANVTDVGSGAAVLPRMMHVHGGSLLSGVHWKCVDLACISLGDDAPENVTMFSPIDFATCEPPADLCDALVSNFGLEYLPPALLPAACARWTKIGARLHVVVHASDSRIDRVAQTTLKQIRWLIDDVGLYEAAKSLLASLPQPIPRRANISDAMNQARAKYNACIDRSKLTIEQSEQPTESPLFDILKIVSFLMNIGLKGNVSEALDALDAHKQAVESEYLRLMAMRESASNFESMTQKTAALIAAGFSTPQLELIHCDLGSIGWALSVTRE